VRSEESKRSAIENTWRPFSRGERNMELADGVSANKIWEREGIPQALRVRIRMSYMSKGARPRHVAALSLILAWQFPKL
jgi:hypothetical protein